jgi:hypothetical protein
MSCRRRSWACVQRANPSPCLCSKGIKHDAKQKCWPENKRPQKGKTLGGKRNNQHPTAVLMNRSDACRIEPRQRLREQEAKHRTNELNSTGAEASQIEANRSGGMHSHAQKNITGGSSAGIPAGTEKLALLSHDRRPVHSLVRTTEKKQGLARALYSRGHWVELVTKLRRRYQ